MTEYSQVDILDVRYNPVNLGRIWAGLVSTHGVGVNNVLSVGVNTGLSLGINTGLFLGINTGLSLGINKGLSLGNSINEGLPLGPWLPRS